MSYRQSDYNYAYQSGDCYYVFNCLYNGIVKLNSKEYKILVNGKNNVSDLSELEKYFTDNGYWVKSDINEFEKYNYLRKIFAENDNDYLEVVITSTLKCNARCFYCYEQGAKWKDMTIETAEKVVSFLKYKMKDKSSLHITWFGGEPLMNPDIINYISLEMHDYVDNFSSSIITNGFLINDDLIEKAKEQWRLQSVQITLDGTESVYNMRKNYIFPDVVSPFIKVLNNIEKLQQKEIVVSIRLNIDSDNFNDIKNLLNYLSNTIDCNNYINIYPAFITKCGEIIDDNNIRNMVCELRRLFPKIFDFKSTILSFPKIRTCIADDPNSIVIGADGEIYDCEHYVGKSEFSKSNVSCCDYCKLEYDNFIKECTRCKFFPKCLGGCSGNRKEKTNFCFIEKYYIQAFLTSLEDSSCE